MFLLHFLALPMQGCIRTPNHVLRGMYSAQAIVVAPRLIDAGYLYCLRDREPVHQVGDLLKKSPCCTAYATVEPVHQALYCLRDRRTGPSSGRSLKKSPRLDHRTYPLKPGQPVGTGILSKTRAPVFPFTGVYHLLSESVPAHLPVEVADTLYAADPTREAEVDLVGRQATVGAVRAVPVIEVLEVGEAAIDLTERTVDRDPHVEGFLERAEQAFDATIRLRMPGSDACVFDAVPIKHGHKLSADEHGAIVGDHARRRTVLLNGLLEDVDDVGLTRPQHALQSHQVAAAIINDAKHGDRDEAEEKDEGVVDAPEQACPLDLDAADDTLLPPRWRRAQQDAADCFAAGRATIEAEEELAELAGAEIRMLAMESADKLFDVRRGAVPGRARIADDWTRWVGQKGRGDRALPGAQLLGRALAEILQAQGEPDETGDEFGKSGGVERIDQSGIEHMIVHTTNDEGNVETVRWMLS